MRDAVEKFRVKSGLWGTKKGDNMGLFFIRFSNDPKKPLLKVICSPLGEGEWEHVSISLPSRVPSWNEMCFVKDLFWDDEVTVVQFHPKKSEYVNNCKTCLHLWRSLESEHKLPPRHLIGI